MQVGAGTLVVLCVCHSMTTPCASKSKYTVKCNSVW